MGENQVEKPENIEQILTPKELEKLLQALATLKNSGWGDLFVRFKGGRVDTIEVTSSILVRDKNT